jgi:cell division transport system permease protein
MSNTIKLTTFDRREEIAIMRMVGAEKNFIRWPFVIEGLVLGITGAFIAFFCQWGLYTLMTGGISRVDTLSLVNVVPFRDMAGLVVLVFLATGFFVGAGGSAIAIRKFLRV